MNRILTVPPMPKITVCKDAGFEMAMFAPINSGTQGDAVAGVAAFPGGRIATVTAQQVRDYFPIERYVLADDEE